MKRAAAAERNMTSLVAKDPPDKLNSCLVPYSNRVRERTRFGEEINN